VDIGLKPDESEYAQFLRDIKKQTPEQVLNSSQDLKKEFQEWKKKPEREKKEELKENKPEDPKPEQPPKSGSSSPKKSPSRSASPSREAAKNPKEAPPPKHTEFNSTALNDALNSLSGALEEDKKGNPSFDGSLPPKNDNMPISQYTKEEAAKLP
jgi:hypothetical protein